MASTTITSTQSKLTPSAIAIAINTMMETDVSFYVHGAPGISKSAVARQVADERNLAFIDFRLTSVAPEDIRGIPDFSDVGGMKGLIWTPPLIFPRDLDLADTVTITESQLVRFYNPTGNNGIYYCKNPEITVQSLEKGKTAEIVERNGNSFVVVVKNENDELTTARILWRVTGLSEAILGLEEFNSAEPAVMAAAYQLILDRRIGDYLVPTGVMILALGNRDGDKGVTFKIPKPVANRFVHCEMVVNFLDWQLWAIKNMIHSSIVGYLTKFQEDLFDEKFAEKPDQSFYTPRSWEFVSKIISLPNLPPMNVLRALVCGALGPVVGTKFLSHRDFMSDMPKVESILNGTTTSFKVKQEYKVQIAYSTCVEICHMLKRESDAIHEKYNIPGKSSEVIHHNKTNSPERKTFLKRADCGVGFAMEHFTPEVLIVFCRMALRVYKLQFSSTGQMAKFNEFLGENVDVVMG
jgi:MoxR-like ATPase